MAFRNFIWLIFVVTALVAWRSEAVAQQTWGSPTPNIPSCSNVYSEPKFLGDGTELTAPAGQLYCLNYDRAAGSYSIQLFDQILQLVEPGHLLRNAYISAHFLNSTEAAAFVCSLTDGGGANVVLSVQAEHVTTSHLDEKVVKNLSHCFENVRINLIGCDPFPSRQYDIRQPCAISEEESFVASHHLKFVILEFSDKAGDSFSSIASFGSGNVTIGSLTTNIEDWIAFKSIYEEQGAIWWSCISNYANDLASATSEMVAQNHIDCTSNYPSSFTVEPSNSGVEIFLTPVQADAYFDRLASEVEAADAVTIVAQFFESKRLLEAMAENDDTQFQLLLDDAYFEAASSGTSANFIQPTKAQELLEFVRENDNVSACYLQTNHDFGINGMTNTVHARSMMFESSNGLTTMIGSAHFRDGAIFRNSEQQIFLGGALASAHKESFFEPLLGKCVDVQAVGIAGK